MSGAAVALDRASSSGQRRHSAGRERQWTQGSRGDTLARWAEREAARQSGAILHPPTAATTPRYVDTEGSTGPRTGDTPRTDTSARGAGPKRGTYNSAAHFVGKRAAGTKPALR